MRTFALLFVSLLVLGSAQAGEVFMTRDAKGNLVYTDRPDSLPAQKVSVATSKPASDAAPASPAGETAPQGAGKSKPDATKQAAEAKRAKELTAADAAKRCIDARARYEVIVNAQRLYEPGATEDERNYLDDDEIDAARASARKAMDDFCAGQ